VVMVVPMGAGGGGGGCCWCLYHVASTSQDSLHN
jgi:hypothetical protein